MPKRFDSFMQSPIGAFTESMAHARDQAEPAVGYIVGGQEMGEPERYQRAVDRYNFPEDTWVTRKSLPASDFPIGLTTGAGFAIFDRGHIVGGHDHPKGNFQHWVYLQQGDFWEQLQGAPLGGSNITRPGAGFHGRGYIFGTAEDKGDNREVQRYDPKTDQWTILGSYPKPTRFFGRVVTIGFKMYLYASARLLGHDSARNDKYDPLTDTWSIAAKAPVVRASAAGGVVKGHAYFQGGTRSYRENNTPAYEAYGYNPKTDAWIEFPPLLGEGKPSRTYHASFVLNQATSIFIAGGMTLSRYAIRETWQYNWSDETWTQKERMLGPNRRMMRSWALWQQ